MSRPWLRSMLFTPGNRLDWMHKAIGYRPDAAIFDLEDAVPYDSKGAAREMVTGVIDSFADDSPALFVRLNSWESGELVDDVLAVTRRGLRGVVLPKTAGPEEVIALDVLLNSVEARAGLARGTVEIVPLPETARAIHLFSEVCAASSRIARVMAIHGLTPGVAGDSLGALGLEPTSEGHELLYLSGMMVVAARAAGIRQILGGMTVDVSDIALLRRSLARARGLGATGSFAIHPTHLPAIHDVFTPAPEQIAQALRVLRAIEQGEREGRAAVRYDGKMVDYAHANASRELLARARACGMELPEL